MKESVKPPALVRMLGCIPNLRYSPYTVYFFLKALGFILVTATYIKYTIVIILQKIPKFLSVDTLLLPLSLK